MENEQPEKQTLGFREDIRNIFSPSLNRSSTINKTFSRQTTSVFLQRGSKIKCLTVEEQLFLVFFFSPIKIQNLLSFIKN